MKRGSATERREFLWNGECNRALGIYRPCVCATCSQGRLGAGYLSYSDALGFGFTIWIKDEEVFRALRMALQGTELEIAATADDGSAGPL